MRHNKSEYLTLLLGILKFLSTDDMTMICGEIFTEYPKFKVCFKMARLHGIQTCVTLTLKDQIMSFP